MAGRGSRGVVGRLRPVLGALVVAYAGWLGVAFLAQRALIYPRQAAGAPADPRPSLEGVEVGWLEPDGARVEWWFAATPGASAAAPAPLALVCHGNAELLQSLADEVLLLRARGFHVLACEYRGYGLSTGAPTQAALVADQRAALALALARPEVDAGRVLYVGRSLGAGVACALARERPPAAALLLSPFTSVGALLRGFGVPAGLARDPYDNLAALRASDFPVLVAHGEADAAIPVAHARALGAARPGVEVVTLPRRGHNDLPWEGPEVQGALDALLARAGFDPGGGARRD